jgi:hypothetical protein
VTDPDLVMGDRDPADVVTGMIEHVLVVASTWTSWNGIPVSIEVDGEGERIYTPHKAIRRVTDHLVDHLAEIEARVAGCQTEPDAWHGSGITTPADLAPFTPEDLEEAVSRLRRLALIFDLRLRSLSVERLDAPCGDGWTVRQIAFHVSGSSFYADAVGTLGFESKM